MNTSLKLLAAAMLAASLAGCASTGNEKIGAMDETTAAAAVQPGMSKQEVRASLGDPDSKGFDQGNEVWTYLHVHASTKASTFIPIVGPFIGGMNATRKQMVIQFTPDGKTAKILWNAGPADVNYGR